MCKEYGRKAFLTTYRPKAARAWILEKSIASLEKAGIKIVLYDRIGANPRVDTVDEGVKSFVDAGCDFLVALGGGSVIDAAKYFSSTAFSGGTSWDYVLLANREAKEFTGGYPTVAVPTVSATGSEANAGGVITNRITEGLILTLMEILSRALEDGSDLEARGQLALCSLLGWSGLQALGRMGTIPIHLP